MQIKSIRLVTAGRFFVIEIGFNGGYAAAETELAEETLSSSLLSINRT